MVELTVTIALAVTVAVTVMVVAVTFTSRAMSQTLCVAIPVVAQALSLRNQRVYISIDILAIPEHLCEVIIKVIARLGDLFKVSSIEIWAIHGAGITVVELPVCQCESGLKSVFYLAAVPAAGLFLFVGFPVFAVESLDFGFVDVDVDVFGLLKAPEVHLPDLTGGILVERGVVEAYVDTGAECFVEGSDAVGC